MLSFDVIVVYSNDFALKSAQDNQRNVYFYNVLYRWRKVVTDDVVISMLMSYKMASVVIEYRG